MHWAPWRVALRAAREVAWLPAVYFQSTDLSRTFSLSPRIQTVDRPMPACPSPPTLFQGDKLQGPEPDDSGCLRMGWRQEPRSTAFNLLLMSCVTLGKPLPSYSDASFVNKGEGLDWRFLTLPGNQNHLGGRKKKKLENTDSWVPSQRAYRNLNPREDRPTKALAPTQLGSLWAP